MVTYAFQKFQVNGVDYPGTPVGSNEQIAINMTADATINAVYVVGSYTLTLSILGQGVTTPIPGVYPYSSDQAVTITATPAQGWKFDHFVVDGSNVTTNPLNLQMNGNHTVQAVFVAIAVRTVTIQTPTGQGSTNPAPGTYTVLDGEVIQVQAIPAAGWQFDRWNGVAGSGNPLSITVTSNISIQAVFTQIPIPKAILTISVTGQALSPAAGSAEYNIGSTAHVIATPADGWAFDHFLLDGVTSISQATIDILMNTDHLLSAVFTAIPPSDQLVLTQGGYQVWQSAATHLYYVKKGETILASDLDTLQAALDFINSLGGNIGGLILPAAGILGVVLFSGGKKK